MEGKTGKGVGGGEWGGGVGGYAEVREKGDSIFHSFTVLQMREIIS
jgi:hypothetical protein